eukprot:CAMPEP_0168751716 /NCGR_PEP_ID=MMETSP0724-20121128/17982_1 /TAXON_ID=265536 /ORGANISM="Amphiprora sp., Strain CCMP467" /LENGTH=202 /DNA_ID=CAMNT_0008799879 /DNA_START=22 /DNA_END=630 /DNA_ORIENTATION=+
MSDDKKPAKTPEEDLVEDEEDEEDLEKLQAEIARMEEEAARINKETEELESKKKEGGEAASGTAAAGAEQKQAKDSCSIYVGQVDYSATPEELVSHFNACGTIERVTIVCDKYSGRPKGFAYLEFQDESSVENAVKLDGSEFKGRQLKVTAKRVNVPNFQGGRGRGRGGRGPPGGRFGRGGRGGRGYRGGYRGGGRGGYYPY